MTATPYRVMRLALFGLQRGREKETRRGWWWEGVGVRPILHTLQRGLLSGLMVTHSTITIR